MKNVKRFVAILISLMMVSLFTASLAETSLKGLSYDELITLQKEITKEIMSRPEWKEVEVPAGTWVVGEDIPEGTYSLRAKDIWEVTFKYYPYVDSDSWDFFVISDKLGKFTFTDGMRIELSGAVIFAPPISLSF